jgi:hypothetical protein
MNAAIESASCTIFYLIGEHNMPFRPPRIVGPQVVLPTAENGFQTDVTEARLDVGDSGEIPKAKTRTPAPAADAPAPAEEVSSANSLEDLGTDAQLQKLSIGDASQLRKLRRTTVDYSDVGNLRRAFFRNTTKPRF